jgi:hypothetical protein
MSDEKKTISVTRALVELKTLGDRIARATMDLMGALPMRGGELAPGMGTEEEFVAREKSGLQKVDALISRYRAVKAALIKSNAVTEVTVAGTKMTVAEAIERKTSRAFDSNLLGRLAHRLADATTFVENANAEAQVRLDAMLREAAGREGPVSADVFMAIKAEFMKGNKVHLVDPLGLKELLTARQEEAVQFDAGVDIALSESNARTDITVE